MTEVYNQEVLARFDRSIKTKTVVYLYDQKEKSLNYKMLVKNYLRSVKIRIQKSDFRR
jgi:hypothetical protein